MYQPENFINEKKQYEEKIQFIEQNTMDEREKQAQLEALKKTFDASMRLYLSPALQTISNAFGITYQTTRETQGYDSNFHKIMTTVPKSKEELVKELQEFQEKLPTLDSTLQNGVQASIEIIATYYELEI